MIKIIVFWIIRIGEQRINKYGLHSIWLDGGGTWYPQACRFLKLNHHIHSSFTKSIIERTMQYIKDRTEGFDDYIPCKKNKCKLNHIKQWLKLFVYEHNKEIMSRLTKPYPFSENML